MGLEGGGVQTPLPRESHWDGWMEGHQGLQLGWQRNEAKHSTPQPDPNHLPGHTFLSFFSPGHLAFKTGTMSGTTSSSSTEFAKHLGDAQ